MQDMTCLLVNLFDASLYLITFTFIIDNTRNIKHNMISISNLNIQKPTFVIPLKLRKET